MRERMYRGRKKSDGAWTYGYLFVSWEQTYILWGTTNDIPNMVEVDPETVGQLIGIGDRDGKELYNGDVVEVTFRGGEVENFKVYYETEHARFSFEDQHGNDWGFSKSNEMRVIGNIHDHPNLIGG